MRSVKTKTMLLVAVLAGILFVGYYSVYTVSEGHTAVLSSMRIVQQLGWNDPLVETEPGLHFKLPFLVNTTLIDQRLRTTTPAQLGILTVDQQRLLLDYYVSWRIQDPLAYYLKTQNKLEETKRQVTQAARLSLQAVSAHYTSQAILSDKQGLLMNTALEQTELELKTLGIAVLDMGFTSIHLSPEANLALLKNKRDEQTQLALREIAIAKTEAENIRLHADHQAALKLAIAKETAAVIRSRGDTAAANIYNAAYSKNPQFAAFYLDMEAYKKGFTTSRNNSVVVLQARKGLLQANKETTPPYAQD